MLYIDISPSPRRQYDYSLFSGLTQSYHILQNRPTSYILIRWKQINAIRT